MHPPDVLEAQRHQAEAQTQQGRGAVVTAIWLFVTVLLTMLPDGG